MQISEETAKIIAVAGALTAEHNMSMINDSMIFASLCLVPSTAKSIIEDYTENMDALLDRLGVDGGFDVDSVPEGIRGQGVRKPQDWSKRIMQMSTDVSMKTGSHGTVLPVHILFVIISKTVSACGHFRRA